MATRKSPASTPRTPAKRTRAAATPNKSPAKAAAKPAAKTAAKPASKTAAKAVTRAAPAAAKSATGFGALSLGAVLAAAGAAAYGLYRLVTRQPAEGTKPTDLMGDAHPDGSERAIEAFRPDPTAAIPASEREQFRPALAGAAAPTLVKGQADDLVRLDAAPS